jgi:DNA-binding transcriptional LysR family regulator
MTGSDTEVQGIRLTPAGELPADRAAEILGRIDAADAELSAHAALLAALAEATTSATSDQPPLVAGRDGAGTSAAAAASRES